MSPKTLPLIRPRHFEPTTQVVAKMMRKTASVLLSALLLSVSVPGIASGLEPSTELSPPAPPFGPATAQQLSDAAGLTSSTVAGGSGPLFDASDPFYVPPADLPPTPGTLIRSQPAPHLLNVTGQALPGSAKKILYTSTTVHGDPVAVSGYVIEPAHAWAGAGPTPTVVFAPGTRGAADSCAPSRSAGLLGAADPTGLTLNANYEIPFQYAASLYGMRVVVTDYIGLGTPGPHTYVNNTEEAHAVLDAARAGLQLAGLPDDSPVGFWGYSQGGGATASAAEHAAAYAPDLNIKGTYAGAPPANLRAVMQAIDGSNLTGVLGYAIEGYSERYPEFKKIIDEKINERGKTFIAENAASCITDTALRWALADTGQFTTSGEKLSVVAGGTPEIDKIFEQESLGKTAPTGPVMLGSSLADDAIPNRQVVELGRLYCARGGEVYYHQSTVASATSSRPYAVDHALGLLLDTPESINYLVDRFNGQPAPGNCGGF